MQVSASMTALPLASVMAETGQLRTQSPHPTHREGLTCDLSYAAAMHNTMEMIMPPVINSFFIEVYTLKLLFGNLPDEENAASGFFTIGRKFPV
jgi:hypothetical protein